jgi:hypothetical protein
MTALELISGALKDLTVLEPGSAPASEDAADALDALNLLVDSYGLQRLLLYTTVRTTKTLSSGVTSYTIGSGASIDVTKPAWIDRASVVVDTTATLPVEVPMAILSPDQWAAWQTKTLASPLPTAIFYDHGNTSAGYGTVYPVPVPNVSTTQLVLYSPGGQVSEFADLTTDYSLSRGYGRLLRKALAMEIAPLFEKQPSPLLVQQLGEAKRTCEIANVRPIAMRCDPAIVGPGSGGHYNPLTDRPNRGGWW